MRLLFITKREPQHRDLIERPYGRFHWLPVELARRGHAVNQLLVSLHGSPPASVTREGVCLSAFDPRGAGFCRTLLALEAEARAFEPDWVIGCSDTWCGWLASRLASRTGACLAVDAYDNFEAYMPWNLPLHQLWRRAVRRADLVTAAGPQLGDLLQSYRPSDAPVAVLPMAADREFVPLNKAACRQALGLPVQATYVGYVGSWSANRGSSLLIDAFRLARAARPDLKLLLSGRPPQEVLNEPGITATGYLPDAQLPALINALDVACVITADTSFGRYSYPAKLCEAMACGVPVVATATEPVRWMLGDRSRHLAPPGDAEIFAERMLDLLAAPSAEYGPRPTWSDQAQRLDYLLSGAEREKR